MGASGGGLAVRLQRRLPEEGLKSAYFSLNIPSSLR
jgi:hypothetical protein